MSGRYYNRNRNNYGYNNNYGSNGYNNNRGSKGYNDKQYSPAEKRAYYKGQGYRAGYEDKALELKSVAEHDSFRNGFNTLDPSKLGPNKRAKNRGKK